MVKFTDISYGAVAAASHRAGDLPATLVLVKYILAISPSCGVRLLQGYSRYENREVSPHIKFNVSSETNAFSRVIEHAVQLATCRGCESWVDTADLIHAVLCADCCGASFLAQLGVTITDTSNTIPADSEFHRLDDTPSVKKTGFLQGLANTFLGGDSGYRASEIIIDINR